MKKNLSKDKIMKLQIQISSHVYPIDLAKDLAIDATSLKSLNILLAKHPAKYAWIGVMYAMAKNLVNIKKDKLQYNYATLDKKLRLKKRNSTVKALESAILRHQTYRDVEKELREAKYNESLLHAALQAYESMKDTMQTISSNMRSEISRGLRSTHS